MVNDVWMKIGQNKVQILLVILFFIGLGAFLTIIHCLAPITLTLKTIEIIFSSTLSLAGILIAVVGILLTLYITREIEDNDKGKEFRILIGIITFSVIISFVTSLLALYLLANPGYNFLLAALPLLFCGIIYINTVIVAATVICIVR